MYFTGNYEALLHFLSTSYVKQKNFKTNDIIRNENQNTCLGFPSYTLTKESDTGFRCEHILDAESPIDQIRAQNSCEENLINGASIDHGKGYQKNCTDNESPVGHFRCQTSCSDFPTCSVLVIDHNAHHQNTCVDFPTNVSLIRHKTEGSSGSSDVAWDPLLLWVCPSEKLLDAIASHVSREEKSV